jgi:4-hydroxy-tetrahydrodipicolinate synthase
MTADPNSVRAGLRGVAVGLLTPFGGGSEVAHTRLQENAERLYDRGARTFLACANISEYHSLSGEERAAVAETGVDALPGDATVLAGTGGPTADAQRLAREHEAAGADAVMVMPPDHTYVHERGLLEYYRRVADATDLPLVPYVRGFDPSVPFLADLSDLPAVVGVKYAIADARKLGRAVAAGADDTVWVDGLAEPYAVTFWVEGAEGFTAGVSNFEPRLGLALYDALAAGEYDRARALRDAAEPFQQFRGGTGPDNDLPGAVSVPAVKRGLERAGLHGGPVREPIVELSDADRERADELYDQLQDDLDDLL